MAAGDYGYTLPYDVSLAAKDVYRAVEATRAIINESSELSESDKEEIVTVGYGHIGDGNLHINVSVPGYEDKAL